MRSEQAARPLFFRDILLPMNYRRGLRRIYVMLTVAWVLVMLFTLPADRLIFWANRSDAWTAVGEKATAAPKSFVPDIDRAALAEQIQQYARIGQKAKAIYPGAYDDLSDVDLGVRMKVKYPALSDGSSDDWPARTQRVLWLFGVLLLPPGCGYIVGFIVIPWIYHGFRQGTSS